MTIEEKKDSFTPVEIELINKDKVKEGYTVGNPIVNPVYIEVTCSKHNRKCCTCKRIC
ncbi:hypothetical protein KHA80_09335 [Anaerobacillus sp. HL2]|nr:hypothetical protein KHA80_09335 [Anaerobacillus sp. HL2]